MNQLDTALNFILNPMVFIVAALAVYSITRLITTDSIADPIRNWIFDRFPHEGYSTKKRPVRGKWVTVGNAYYINEGTWLGDLIHCPWCSGFWVSLLFCAGFVASPIIATAVSVPWALRIVPGVIESVIG